MALSVRIKKLIRSLQQKKYRKEEQLFVVEGAKNTAELLKSDFEVTWLAGTIDFLDEHQYIIQKRHLEVEVVRPADLEGLGNFQTNDSVVAMARIKAPVLPMLKNEYSLVLDDIRDPGNLGTIIRTADWYGVRQIVASLETADFYNPKVISATMGSFCRVNVYYADLPEFLANVDVPVYGTFLDGTNIHQTNFGKEGILVIGNESHGISREVAHKVQHRITIPGRGAAESLNAAIATAVALDNIFRL